MGIESPVPTRIEDLDPTLPLTGDPVSEGDNHLRNTKAAITGSFPSLGPNAVTATADDLNKLNSTNIGNEFVQSFNTRTGDVLPAAGDYEIDQLSDVDTTTTAPVSGDLLQFNGTNWVPYTPVRGITCAQVTDTTYNLSASTETVQLSSSIYASSGLNYTGNRITNNTGETVVVKIDFSASIDRNNSFSLQIAVDGVGVNTAMFTGNGTSEGGYTLTAVQTLTDGQYIQVFVSSTGTRTITVNAGGTLTAQIIEGA